MTSYLIEIKVCDSTNSELERIIASGEKIDRMAVRSDFQHNGKGMMGKVWESNKEENILISTLYLPKNIRVSGQFIISKALALGTFNFIKSILPNDEVKIKWPNDILVNGKKISGSLIQCSVKGDLVLYAIQGVGINVNQTSFNTDFAATSLFQVNGIRQNLKTLTTQLLKEINTYLDLIESNKEDEINRLYHNELHGFNEFKSYSVSGTTFEGKILEIAEDGRMHLEKKDGSRNYFEIKEIVLNQALSI